MIGHVTRLEQEYAWLKQVVRQELGRIPDEEAENTIEAFLSDIQGEEGDSA
jgi:hypothetical protein